MKKIGKMVLSLVGLMPSMLWANNTVSNTSGDKLASAKNLKLKDVKITSFHNIILPDRSKEISVEEAWENFNLHFLNENEDEKDLIFSEYVEKLIEERKIIINSDLKIMGNESGITM